MKLIVVRHGETKENLEKIVYGHRPGELTSNGIEQANKTGVALANEKIDVIFCSDLKRCIDTATIMMKHLSVCPLKLTPLLREQQQDSLNGKLVEEVDWDNLPSDVESEQQMSERAINLLKEEYEKFAEKTVLFVTHKRFANILNNVLLGNENSDKSKLDKIFNSSISVYSVNDKLVGDPMVLHNISHI
jgi:probable phosphoglycerate mutase